VHELHAEGAAVGFAKKGKDLAEGARAAAAKRAGIENSIEVGIRKTESGKGEVGIFGWGQAEGIKMGEGVTEGAVSKKEIIEASLGKDVTGRSRAGGAIPGRGTELASEFKTLKKTTPDRFDRGGIGFPLFVEILQQGGVASVAESAQSGGWGGGGAVGVQPVQDGKGGIGLRRRLKVAHHDALYLPAIRLSNRVRNPKQNNSANLSR
jgi:hypothetical protein